MRGSASNAVAYACIAVLCKVAAVTRALAGDHSLTGAQLGLTYVTAASTPSGVEDDATKAAATNARMDARRGVIE